VTAHANEAFVGLGANLGDAQRTLEEAVVALAGLGRVVALSSLYRSAPVDAQGPDFLNAVARVETPLGAEALLDALLAVETEHGRQRPYRNAPRTLDLDLLRYGELRLDTPKLTLPHPRAHQRAFVLAPMAELLPGGDWPGHGPIDALLQALGDGQRIERLARPWAGDRGAGAGGAARPGASPAVGAGANAGGSAAPPDAA
jgi:2-amino-4-hydroxy-6-hydroxymethyldihydropteridine diphosphokinase